jgi:serine O-acetyltransferase
MPPEQVGAERLRHYVLTQLNALFPPMEDEGDVPVMVFQDALERARFCLAHVRTASTSGFSHLNSGHYATFLYFLSVSIWHHTRRSELATRVFLLNKALNGIDLFYEVEMPRIFLVGHTVGMVFAKAVYADFCVFHQGCTVGRALDSRPNLERGAVLFPGSSIIGECHVRENSVISAGVQLINADTPGNCLVFSGKSGKPKFRDNPEYFADRYFDRSGHL